MYRGSSPSRNTHQADRSARAIHPLFICLIGIGTLQPTIVVFAAERCPAANATKVVSVQGNVTWSVISNATLTAAKFNDLLCVGDTVRVGAKSRAVLRLPNETTIPLDQNTIFQLKEAISEKDPTLIELLQGAIHIITRTPKPFKVNTPYLNAVVEGTEFYVGVDKQEARVAVIEGKVNVSNEQGAVLLVDNEAATARKGQAPQKTLTIKPRDAVQWALYYPPLFDPRSRAGGENLAASHERYSQGDITGAIERLDAVPEAQRNGDYATYRAGLLLLVGRADEAEPDIERALAENGNNTDALSLKAIIAIVKNDQAKALELANQAVNIDDKSASARIALSYALQANFKIEDALKAAREATLRDADNALAWARVAELELSIPNYDKSKEAAEKAVKLNPNLARTQSILGFASLTRIEIKAAKESFNRAIELDQADPLPRLGLGLATIREGNLEQGREQIEVAASLDSENSLIRSYLAKAYYEENRDGLANIQFDLAKAKDPNDPTPWLYEAVAKNSENRAVQAFSSLQRAINLNDSRAVSRSRFLLDQDLASVNSGLAKIYSSLGFEQLALSTVYRALDSDPTNSSLHNFLAETYFGIPHYDVARASESLQAKLNQPIGTLYTDPLLGESRLFLLKSSGINNILRSDPSRPLDRPGLNLNIQAFAGNHDTFGGGLNLKGVVGNLAGSIAAAEFESDGLRPSEPFKERIANAFVQSEINSNLRLQGEWVRSYINRIELLSPFDPDSILPLSEQEQFERFRVGLKGRLGDRADFLLSAITQKTNFRTSGLGLSFEDSNTRTSTFESQTTFSFPSMRLVAGVSRLTGRATSNPTDLAFERFSSKRSQDNVYVYAYPKLMKNLMTATIGVSWDRSKLNGVEVVKLNPKFGLNLQYSPTATFRISALRSLQREFIANQTIEPTQVTGTPQFLFGSQQTRWNHYGIGADFRVSQNTYSGIDVVKRYGEYPTSGTLRNFQSATIRTYWDWIVSPNLAFAANYFFDEYQEPVEAGGALLSRTVLRTHQVPLVFTWQLLPRTVLRVRATGIRQTGLLQAEEGNQFRPSRKFWLGDLDFEYRNSSRRWTAQLVVRNIFDRRFEFEEPDVRNPVLSPSRLILGSIKIELQ